MKIATVNNIARSLRPRAHKPWNDHDLRRAETAIRKRGWSVAKDGRCYPKFIPSPPKGKRWEKGHLVPRHG